MSAASRVNRGRAAAAENRAAILAAAREIFAEHGRTASMTLIAQTAGVGQGSLYRHFPTRGQLIHAVYESNIAELESLARQDDSTIDELLEALYRQLTDSAAFIAVFDSADGQSPHLTSIRGKLRKLLSDKLSDRSQRGRLRDEITTDDVYVALGMLAALLHQTPSSQRRGTARHAWGLLLRSLYR
ncbi:helix-turn-helix domain-containing protein [Nocardia sp. NPDC005366]|uniref:TetR/AcrR family transcriptional regulator n=1 Tax=Nocardia sp. NPDC005366 TaxID=3156878 RepID=UPI0033BF932B